MANYTEDGHLIGKDGWIMPKNAHEFYERYRDKVRLIAKKSLMFSRLGDWHEIEQRTWLALFRRPGESSFYPQATDYIHYLNFTFARSEESRINVSALLAYIKTIVRTSAITDKQCKGSGALEQRGIVSLSDYENDKDADGSDTSFEDWIHDQVTTFHAPMFNDPDRVLYLQEFIAYVEEHAPHLMKCLLSIEETALHKRVSNPIYSPDRWELLALAEKFEGKTPTGRTEWHISKDYIKLNNKPRAAYRPFVAGAAGESFLRVLNSLRERPHSIREIAAKLGIEPNLISHEGTVLRKRGLIERTDEIRERSRVVRITALGMVTHTVDDLVQRGVKKRGTAKFPCLVCDRSYTLNLLLNHQCRPNANQNGVPKQKEPKQRKEARIVSAPRRGRYLEIYNCVAARPEGVSSLDVAVLCNDTRGRVCVILDYLKKRGCVSSLGGRRYQIFKPTETPFFYRKRGIKKKMQTISPRGLNLIKVSEGFSASVYSDVAGFKTVGYGHKLLSGESFPAGVTLSQATSLLTADVVVAEAVVQRLVTVPLSQGQFDALVDFVFNLGGGRLASSTLLRDLNATKYAEAGQQLLLWDHAGHLEIEGLKKRREAEHVLWNEKAGE